MCVGSTRLKGQALKDLFDSMIGQSVAMDHNYNEDAVGEIMDVTEEKGNLFATVRVLPNIVTRNPQPSGVNQNGNEISVTSTPKEFFNGTILSIIQ